MKQLTILLAVISLFAFKVSAQEEFKPNGKPAVKVFSNFHYGNDGTTGFEITRAYFGYKYEMSQNWSGNVTLDVGDPSIKVNDTLTLGTSLMQTAYLKNALLSYEKGKFSIDFGLIGTKQFKLQEKMWGHRYIMKSFQDEYKFGSSADLGLAVDYEATDFLSFDLSVLNGEGYKLLQADDRFKTGLGITIKPFEGLTIREYVDFMPGDAASQITTASFVNYKKDKINVGVEYNHQLNNRNNDSKDLFGYSAYASYNLSEKYQVFGRYDNLSSNVLTGANDPWNLSRNGSAIIAGLQYKPLKYISLALDYQGWMPEKSGEDLSHFAFMNIEIAF